MIKKMKFGKVEDFIDEMCESSDEYYENNMETVLEECSDEESKLYYDSHYIVVPELNIRLHAGIMCNYDEDENNFMPDFSVTVIFDATTGKYLYWEQDGYLISVYNYYGSKYPMDKLGNMDCELVM